ncbi:MAG: DUF6327 family protein [Draconibacterium sp.]
MKKVKKKYNSHEEIVRDLKILKLKREISIEEFKLIKTQFKEDLSISGWLRSLLQIAGNYSFYRLSRRIFR